jgi:hypothetical protein
MNNKHQSRYLALLLIPALFLAGCAPKSSAAPTPSTNFPGPVPVEKTASVTSTVTNTAAITPTATPDEPVIQPSGTSVSLPTGTTKPKTYESDLPLPPPGFTVDYTRTDLNRSVKEATEEYEGRLIDTHTHLDTPTDGIINADNLMKVIEAIENANVDSIIVMPVPNQGVMKYGSLCAEQNKMLLELGGEKILLFGESGFISNWLDTAYTDGYTKTKLKEKLLGLSDDITDPDYSGIGEIGLYHFNKTGNQSVIEYPPTFAPFLNVISAIAEAGVWLDLHVEPVDPDGISYEDQVFGGLALLFQQFPNLKLILSHTAMTNPTNARRILETYPNVMMNIKPVVDHDDWRNLEPICNTQGFLYNDWAELFEDMPERFMAGTDMKFGGDASDTLVYTEQVDLMRKILGSINPDTAAQIAYQNAERIFQ